MLITTANDLPGYEITETLGEVFGLTVRSRNIGSQLGAGLKSIMGGELKGMTKALVDSRQQVIDRMVQEAEEQGGEAIVAMRCDTSEMGPLADALAVIGASPETSAEILELRRDVTLQGLEPVPGAAETIAAMRERGLMIGLITVCSEDVPLLWQETAFHGLFDAEVFS